MRLNGKFVAELTETDMAQLVQDGRAEDQNLDFKREAYGKGDTDKKELVKDVLGFANASGGVILIGVAERGEIAHEIPGIELATRAVVVISLAAATGGNGGAAATDGWSFPH
jgi:predicted HTH transcriptional regulator